MIFISPDIVLTCNLSIAQKEPALGAITAAIKSKLRGSSYLCRVGSLDDLDAGRSQYAAASGASSVEEAKVHKQEIEAKGIYDLLSSYRHIRILFSE